MESTTNSGPAPKFDKATASSYNERWSKVASLKDALHLCMRFVLADLPSDARVLCVGVGTGAELFYLAEAFPRWKFTAVEPSSKMLDICRARADEQGLGTRCEFHEGTIDTLPADGLYDAVTALLVSHYLGDRAARKAFFRALSGKLRSGGILINADLSAEIESNEFAMMFETWKSMLSFSGMSTEEIEKYSSNFTRGKTAIPAGAIEEILTSSGFQQPILFCQTLLIHAWYSTR
jgi:tRNA (cmo5U34)-methyltransferase